MSHQPVLVVDLDETLIRTDLLYESFFGLVSARPMALAGLVGPLRRGKAALKAALSTQFDIDPATLPYNQTVLDEIRAARSAGRKVALVSASDTRYVSRIADHLDLFDEAFGSDGTRNLGGANKAAFLTERYADAGFDYIGDSPKDLPVWKEAATAITINAPPKLRTAAEATGATRHLDPRARATGNLRPYLKALRPHQWMKNVLIFLPLVAAHDFSAASLLAATMAFIAFSLTASSVYVLNDLLDLAADRVHPRKRNRPFASGAVPLKHAVMMGLGTLAAAVLIALSATPLAFMGVLVFYYIITMAYSMSLKRKPVIDICILAGLYTIRVIAGSYAVGLYLSPWMLAFCVFLFLALAAVKRQAELVDGVASGKAEIAGRGYTSNDLPVVEMMAIAAGYNSVLVLALYISSDATFGLYESPLKLWAACPILLFWISRIVMIAHNGRMDDDPVVFAVRDRVSQLCGVAVVALGIAATWV